MKIEQNIIQSGHIFQIYQPDIEKIYPYAKDPYEY